MRHHASVRRGLARGLLALALAAAATPVRASETVTVTVLHTSDVHGNLLPWDYLRERPADVGLARVATRVAAIRRETPNVVLLDGGDTIEGAAPEYLQSSRAKFAALLSREGAPDADPMMRAMSLMGYDAMAVGNHEFNFGLAVFRKAQKDAAFPWLSANTLNAADGSPAFPEYLVKTVGGVRIGVLGLTTPNIPNWEPESNRPGLRWEDPVATAKRLLPRLRGTERCDAVVVLFHSGLEADPLTGVPDGTEAENRIVALAREVPGIDLILGGHSHRLVPLTRVAGVPVLQPGRWAEALDRVDLAFEKRGARWALTGLTAEQLPSNASVATDPGVAEIAAPFDRAARRWLDETVAEAEEAFPAERARLEDTALLDLVNDTQRRATGADLSMTSLLPGGRYAGLPKGRITVRDLYALYPYENRLVVVEIDGAQLKACLERAAEFYAGASFDGGRLVLTPNPRMIPYNFDAVQGAAYRIDPTAPVGQRVKDLAVKGRRVEPTDRFTLAVNSYRAQGGGGYSALRNARVVKTVPVEIRDLLIETLRAAGRIRPAVDHNWVVAPDAVFAPPRPAPTPGPPAPGTSR
ncbi:MAG TPA: bifunctional UDP-sugar hydrolase/5'-nucleotidase [Thermoanaerobaculia bacterium]|nr:bifunctional UDP-sugar hydrolase/5'-nucleotidase [Thermoanaerobaculia bacterium]